MPIVFLLLLEERLHERINADGGIEGRGGGEEGDVELNIGPVPGLSAGHLDHGEGERSIALELDLRHGNEQVEPNRQMNIDKPQSKQINRNKQKRLRRKARSAQENIP